MLWTSIRSWRCDNTETLQEKGSQLAITGFLTLIAYYFNIVAVPIIVLVVAMIIDYITGMVAAYHSAELSSKKGIFGIVKKVCYLALVCVGIGVDWLIYSGLQSINVNIGYTIFFGVLVTIWLIINELISILENLGSIGVPLPKFLVNVCKRLKTTTESVVGDKEKEESEEKKDEKGN